MGLRVADLERSLGFYMALGYEVVGTVPDTDLGTLTMLKLPADEFVTIELVHDAAMAVVDPGGLSHLVVQVEDLHETLDRLAPAGLQAEPPSSPDGTEHFWTTWLTDPDGYRIELVQWPAGHANGLTSADFPDSRP